MTERDADSLAAEYVLGTLAGEEREQFAEALSRDPALEKLVTAWELRLAPLGEHIGPMRPPDSLWDKIDSEVDELTSPAARAVNIRTGEGDWKPLVHGVDKKILFRDSTAGTESFLLRFAPGAWLPAHDHRLSEQCLMLEGELLIGDRRFGPGDFHAIPAGTPHPAVVSEGGALAFIVGEMRETVG